MGADYTHAQWLPCKNFWSGNAGMDYVVVHATASGGVQTAMQLATGSEFNDGNSASVHYINDRDTSLVVQVVSEDDSAWGNCCATGASLFDHTYNWNHKTISIENVKYSSDNSEALQPWQYQNLLLLVRDICRRHNIPLVQGTSTQRGVIYHHDLDPINKGRCPGTFPYATFFQDLQGAPVTPLTATHEVATYPQSYQLETGETEDACGFFSNALAKAMGQPPQTPPHLDSEGVDVLADQYYVKYDGPNTGANHNGMSTASQEGMLHDLGIPFTHLAVDSTSSHAHDVALITAWLRLGYPVIITIPETSVYDMEVGGGPYSWVNADPTAWTGVTHIMTATGIATAVGFAGHLLYRDTVNYRQGPRTYSNDHIIFYRAIAINPPWLPKQVDGFDPLLIGGTTMGVPVGWKDDGRTLTAPNGHRMVLGMRSYVLGHAWDPSDQPQEEEHGQMPIETYYGSPTQGGTQQICLYTALNYTTARGVYRMGIGNEFLGTRRDLAACRSIQPAPLPVPLPPLPPIDPNPQLVADLAAANAKVAVVADIVAQAKTLLGELQR